MHATLLLLLFALNPASALSNAEFAVERLSKHEETKATAEEFRAQLPALGVAWAKDEVEVIDRGIAEGKADEALARARHDLEWASKKDYLKPHEEALKAARDRASLGTLEMKPGPEDAPVSALVVIGARARWAVSDQDEASPAVARGRAISSGVTRRFDRLSSEAQGRGMPALALLMARVAEAHGPGQRDFAALSAAIVADTKLKAATLIAAEAAKQAGPRPGWQNLRTAGIACGALEEARRRIYDSGDEKATVDLEITACTPEVREVVKKTETYKTTNVVPTGRSNTRVTKRGECRERQSKSWGCTQYKNSVCVAYGEVWGSSGRDCTPDETSTTQEYRTETQEHTRETKKTVGTLKIVGTMKVVFRGVSREVPFSISDESDDSLAIPYAEAGSHLAFMASTAREQITEELEAPQRRAAAAPATGLALQEKLLRAGENWNLMSTQAVFVEAYGFDGTQAKAALQTQTFQPAAFKAPHWNSLTSRLVGDGDQAANDDFRAVIEARVPKAESSFSFGLGSFDQESTLDSIGTLDFGMVSMAPSDPGVPGGKGFTIGFGGLFSERDGLEWVFGLGTKVGLSANDVLFDGRLHLGAAITGWRFTLYALATAAYESYAVSRALVQPEGRLLTDFGGGMGLELSAGLPLFSRDPMKLTERDVRPLRLGARVFLPEGLPVALTWAYARDPDGTRFTLDLGWMPGHRAR